MKKSKIIEFLNEMEPWGIYKFMEENSLYFEKIEKGSRIDHFVKNGFSIETSISLSHLITDVYLLDDGDDEWSSYADALCSLLKGELALEQVLGMEDDELLNTLRII